MRSAAAYAIARPSCSSVAPAAQRLERARRRPRPGRRRGTSTRARRRRRRRRARRTRGDGGVERVDRRVARPHEIVRVTPLAELLGALTRPRSGGTSVGSTSGARVLAEVLERLERLVREVDRVAAVDEDVIGDRREHHRLDRRRAARSSASAVSSVRSAASDERVSMKRRYHCASRSDGNARRVGSGPTGKRGAWLRGVVRDEREAVHERERAVVGVEVGEQVRHRDEHGEAGAPPAARGTCVPKSTPVRTISARADARFEQPEHRLGDHERDALLEPVAQTVLEVPDRIARRRGRARTRRRRAARRRSRARRRPRGRACSPTRGRSARGASGT